MNAPFPPYIDVSKEATLSIEIVPIFVSSTWLDLQPERQAVETALQRLREVKFNGMEYFGSRDETTRGTSLAEVDHSRVYVGIIGGRYGSGITEDEYRRARALKLPCFIYFKREADIPASGRDATPEVAAKLAAFKADLQRNHIITEFASPEELATKVTADLHRWLVDQYLTPKLTQAAQHELPREQARALLAAIKDESGLNPALLSAARNVVTASGAGSVAIGGNVQNSTIITGDNHNTNNRPTGDVIYGNKTVIHKSPLPLALALIAAALVIGLSAYAYWRGNGGEELYRVRVTVTNPQGVPTEEAKVWSSLGGEAKKVAGGWQFDIPAASKPQDGKLTIFASFENAFLTGQTDLTLDKDFNPALTIKLTRDTSARLRGQVTDAQGRAVAGARVFIVGYEAETITTATGGNFELPAHAAVGQYVEVVAEKPGQGVGRLNHQAGDVPVRLVLRKD